MYEQQDELEDNEVEYEVVVRAGFTDPAYEELYGEDVQLTLDLQLYREQNDWQVSHLFMHTPIPTDHSTDDEVKFITPEQFAQEYYSEVTNENWEVIPSYIADEWQQQEALTDQELAERYAMRVPRVEDAQVLMGDVFHEQIQQAIPDLPAMKADETSYIVRAEYKLEGEERFLAEDLLLVQQDERFRIVEFHQYDAFESIN
ncbi:hypothetical protein JCM19037_1531 [Geomicrobium sp. JCM 19037]|uniref:hypothetical protein n=1 Tax=Geomicrobium sp. JCM 19037 TaxID=1460634 RepID=UPI00045F1F12|nr:hypothetical protein [Geomicrobium sp. JCM 19037]GAK03226.1 hypothetical protein JCM19037_1531 [Geomicrobium sp. JCM 19037]